MVKKNHCSVETAIIGSWEDRHWDDINFRSKNWCSLNGGRLRDTIFAIPIQVRMSIKYKLPMHKLWLQQYRVATRKPPFATGRGGILVIIFLGGVLVATLYNDKIKAVLRTSVTYSVLILTLIIFHLLNNERLNLSR